MIKNTLFLGLAASGLAGFTSLSAEGLPDKQPNLIHIWRESVKPGRGAEHAKNEAGYAAALEKAKNPTYALAMVSETGPDEAWWVTPFDSNAAIGEGRAT